MTDRTSRTARTSWVASEREPRNAPLTEHERQDIKVAIEEGKSNNAIALEVGCSSKTVSRFRTAYNNGDFE